MAKRSRLILTKDGERSFGHLADGIGRALDSVLRSERMKKKELAEKAVVDQAVISRVIEGSRNLELRTVGALFGAAGYVLDVSPKRIHAPPHMPTNHPSTRESLKIESSFGGGSVSGAISATPMAEGRRITVGRLKISNG